MRVGNEDQSVAVPMPATGATPSAASADRQGDRRQTQRLLLELLVIVVLVIPICVYEFAVDPVRRGFFCDDETIAYPFRDNTITPVMLGLIVGLLPLLVFVLVEYVSHLRAGQIGETQVLLQWRVSTWYVELGRQATYFIFGLLLTFDATEVGKYTIGRLRPHFLAVCQPQLTDGSLCSDPVNLHRYVENYECAGEGFSVEDVRQSRLSFPSGHSSLIFYAMLYVALYLQLKITWRGSKLGRHFVQFLLIMLAWYTALSRVMDNWHHWSDVLCGSLLGIAGALITVRFIARMFDTPFGRMEGLLGGGLRRENTAATLQEEVCPSTPPPYTANSNYSEDDYRTKV
ncbi:hypothetical protein KR074_012456 [Drosophila pseudoananassae]|nr:hypothetical protein KR074_012456 [Drosophila pseudoananassae]